MADASPDENEVSGNPEQKTKKPSDSAFKQQRLPAWQPILTAGTVLPTFFCHWCSIYSYWNWNDVFFCQCYGAVNTLHRL